MPQSFVSCLSRGAVPALLLFTTVGIAYGQQAAQITSSNGVTTYAVPAGAQGQIDFVNAKAMPLPSNLSPADARQAQIQSLLSSPYFGMPAVSPGQPGTGIPSPAFVGVPAEAADGGITPQDYGTYNHPFSTAKADLNSGGSHATNTYYPYRPAGKLFFNIGNATYICSASLIKRGVVVTAAHCVANFGQKQFYSNWQFIPGYRNGAAPYGTYTVARASVMSSYYNGTDSCYQSGVVCTNDVAILVVNPSATGAYPGTTTGWFGYGYNGYGFTSGQTHITQLGYPAGLDNAAYMERNDSSGYTNATYSNNTVIGSNMDGGSSGGPWVVNFGIKPTLTGETNGSASSANIVVGVTSWGYTSTAPKEQGASAFTNTNIVTLVNGACSAIPAACS